MGHRLAELFGLLFGAIGLGLLLGYYVGIPLAKKLTQWIEKIFPEG